MADNATLPATAAVVAADDIGGVLHQRVKFGLGADGAYSDLAPGRVAEGLALPVVLSDEDLTALQAASSAGLATSAKQDTMITALQSTTAAPIVGGTAADAAISGAPVTVGARASAAIPAAVSADGDVANGWTDLYGRLIVGNAPRARLGRAAIKLTSTTTETTLIAAGAAGVFRDVYRLTITNTSATATKVTIRDVTAGGTPEVYYLAAGETKGFSGPIDAADVQTTAASAWTATCGTSVADVEICARYVERKA